VSFVACLHFGANGLRVIRNGDYTPTRFQAQSEAVSTVFTAKTDSNPESAVGLMTMAGKA